MKMRSIILISLFVIGAMAGKYSKEVNEQKASDKSNNQVEFRIAKLNQIWEKAIRVSDVYVLIVPLLSLYLNLILVFHYGSFEY